MAIDRIPIDKSKQAGNNAVRLGDLISEIQLLCTKLNNIVGHCNDGTTYTTLESQFGLQAGAGANFATLIGNTNTLFNTNATVAGQTRLDQINEIIGRVSGQ